MANTGPLDPSILVARLQELRHTLLQLVSQLQIVAERAEMFSGRRRPRLSGTPQLETQRAYLNRLYSMAVCDLDGRKGQAAAELHAVLTAADERPPRPVPGAAYTFAAVVCVARVVHDIGWGDEKEHLRDVRDPWHKRTPAQRLGKAELWVWDSVQLPYFGDRAVSSEFATSVVREFDRAGRLAADCDAVERSGSRRRRRTQVGLGPGPSVERGRTPERDRHKVSAAVKAQVLSVFEAGVDLGRHEVRERMRGVNTEMSPSHIGRALTELADEGKLKRVRRGWYRLP